MAPAGYLICDGTVKDIREYPALPDMRNLFLRGYHCEAEEWPSGEVGVKQEGTEHPTVTSSDGIAVFKNSQELNKDSEKVNL